MNKALIVVNLQNDFCTGGALEFIEGETIIPAINDLIPHFEIIIYTRDWHPENHCSFVADPQFSERSWPVHCVANTHGADFHPELSFNLNAVIIDKGMEADQDTYSGFQDTNLARNLRKFGIDSVFITGLTAEYSVKATAFDAVKEGFTVYLVEDAVKGADTPPGTAAQAIADMKEAGVKVIKAAEVAHLLK
jgi:nicotinamidase/pyrazinamidase